MNSSVEAPSARLTTQLLVFAILATTAAGIVVAQSEEQLRRHFEGRTVVVLLDLPSAPEGVEIYPAERFRVNFKTYSNLLKSHGVSIRRGENAVVTSIQVGAETIVLRLAKSSREPDRTPVAKGRQGLTKVDSSSASLVLRYGRGILSVELTPKALMEVLADYLEFHELSRSSATDSKESIQKDVPGKAASEAGLTRLRRGMSRAEVEKLLGPPDWSEERFEGNLVVSGCRYVLPGEIVEAEFLENLLVRYVIRSRP